MPKRDKLSLGATLETNNLEALNLAIEATFSVPREKLTLLPKLQIKLEMLKHLIRLANELSIISAKDYLRLAQQLVEASKMTTGWLNYIQRKERV